MNWNSITSDSVSAFMRNVYAALAGCTGTLLVIGISQADIDTFTSAVHLIGEGLSSIVAGVAVMVPLVTGSIAAYKASRKGRLVAMDKDPEISIVKTVPGSSAEETAKEIPGKKVT